MIRSTELFSIVLDCFAHIHAQIYKHRVRHECINKYMHIYMHIYIYMCMCMYLHTCICMLCVVFVFSFPTFCVQA